MRNLTKILIIILFGCFLNCNLANSHIKKVSSTDQNSEISEKKNTYADKLGKISVDGIWKFNCEHGLASININGQQAFLVLIFNEVYIDLVEIERNEKIKSISYKLKEIPEDKGSFGVKLNWKEYVNDEPIAYVKIINDNTIQFYWYGFYNKKTNKRELQECDFNQDTKNEKIYLKRCIE